MGVRLKDLIIPMAVIAVLLSSTLSMSGEGRAVFRGVSIGMTKDNAVSTKIEGFQAILSPGMKLENGLTIAGSVIFRSVSGDDCASLALSENGGMVEKVTLNECFFGLKDANLQSFVQQFIDKYDVSRMTSSHRVLNNGIEEAFEGETPYGESVKISKVTTSHRSMGRVVLPIKIEVTRLAKPMFE